jgi:hypothetical protein
MYRAIQHQMKVSFGVRRSLNFDWYHEGLPGGQSTPAELLPIL